MKPYWKCKLNQISMKTNFFKNLKLIFATGFILSMLTTAISQTIVYPSNGSNTELFAAKEVRRYIYLRTDQKLTVQGLTSLPSSGDLILVANDNNAMVNSLRGLINHTTTPGGIILKSVNSGGRNILVITGNNSESTLIAAYRFAEHLGVGFDLAGDAIPDKKITLSITGFDEAGERRFEITGFLPFHDFYEGPDLWSTDEYMVVINQLSKLGMNFIGLHTYPTYSTPLESSKDIRTGPEPNVWIGVQGDYDNNGNVSWSYPAYYAHSHRPHEIWGTVTWNTSNYFGGSDQIFPRDFWGSDVFGKNAMPTDVESSNAVFNKTGKMFKKAFGFAKDIGVKTALGTELPMGFEPQGPEVDFNWIRVMPPELQARLRITGPSDPTLPAKVKDVYKGIFDRITKTHHLDYFWLWSWEVWGMHGVDDAQRNAFKADIILALEAANEMNVPFKMAHAGWMLGDGDDPLLFDDIFPKDCPFYGLWDRAHLFDLFPPGNERVKWAATWLEEDWGLVQPQLEMYRVYDDVKAAIDRNCHGLIAKGWRTRTASATSHSIKDALWCYGSTGSPVIKAFPADKNTWIDAIYLDWATRWFGPEVAPNIANILGTLDKSANPRLLPIVSTWDTHNEGLNASPGAIDAKIYKASEFSFVSDLEALRPQVVGAGNLERFDYWLKMFQSYRKKAEYGGAREGGDGNRSTMATLFNEFITLDIERMVNVADVGEIMKHNVLNWHQLVQLDWGPGVDPSKNYTGSSFIKVMPIRTQVEKNEALTLNIIAMGVGTPTLKYRELGGGSWASITASNVGRSVYSATIPTQTQDFEYYLESGSVVFPVTANSTSPIYQTVVVMAAETDPCEGLSLIILFILYSVSQFKKCYLLF
jgi:hypothetical protein